MTGPAVTIREALLRDTWNLRTMLSTPYEAVCHLCEEPTHHGPDSKASTERWAAKHLWDAHRVQIVGSYEVESGAELWPDGVGSGR